MLRPSKVSWTHTNTTLHSTLPLNFYPLVECRLATPLPVILKPITCDDRLARPTRLFWMRTDPEITDKSADKSLSCVHAPASITPGAFTVSSCTSNQLTWAVVPNQMRLWWWYAFLGWWACVPERDNLRGNGTCAVSNPSSYSEIVCVDGRRSVTLSNFCLGFSLALFSYGQLLVSPWHVFQ